MDSQLLEKISFAIQMGANPELIATNNNLTITKNEGGVVQFYSNEAGNKAEYAFNSDGTYNEVEQDSEKTIDVRVSFGSSMDSELYKCKHPEEALSILRESDRIAEVTGIPMDGSIQIGEKMLALNSGQKYEDARTFILNSDIPQNRISVIGVNQNGDEIRFNYDRDTREVTSSSGKISRLRRVNSNDSEMARAFADGYYDNFTATELSMFSDAKDLDPVQGVLVGKMVGANGFSETQDKYLITGYNEEEDVYVATLNREGNLSADHTIYPEDIEIVFRDKYRNKIFSEEFAKENEFEDILSNYGEVKKELLQEAIRLSEENRHFDLSADDLRVLGNLTDSHIKLVNLGIKEDFDWEMLFNTEREASMTSKSIASLETNLPELILRFANNYEYRNYDVDSSIGSSELIGDGIGTALNELGIENGSDIKKAVDSLIADRARENAEAEAVADELNEQVIDEAILDGDNLSDENREIMRSINRKALGEDGDWLIREYFENIENPTLSDFERFVGFQNFDKRDREQALRRGEVGELPITLSSDEFNDKILLGFALDEIQEGYKLDDEGELDTDHLAGFIQEAFQMPQRVSDIIRELDSQWEQFRELGSVEEVLYYCQHTQHQDFDDFENYIEETDKEVFDQSFDINWQSEPKQILRLIGKTDDLAFINKLIADNPDHKEEVLNRITEVIDTVAENVVIALVEQTDNLDNLWALAKWQGATDNILQSILTKADGDQGVVDAVKDNPNYVDREIEEVADFNELSEWEFWLDERNIPYMSITDINGSARPTEEDFKELTALAEKLEADSRIKQVPVAVIESAEGKFVATVKTSDQSLRFFHNNGSEEDKLIPFYPAYSQWEQDKGFKVQSKADMEDMSFDEKVREARSTLKLAHKKHVALEKNLGTLTPSERKLAEQVLLSPTTGLTLNLGNLGNDSVRMVFDAIESDAYKVSSIVAKSNNNLTTLQGLNIGRFPNLTSISITESALTSISGIEQLYELNTLNFSGNRIKDLEPLADLKNLENLSVMSNQIESLDPLKDLPKLVSLGLNANRISDFSPLYGKEHLKSVAMINTLVEEQEVAQIGDLYDTDAVAEYFKGKSADQEQEEDQTVYIDKVEMLWSEGIPNIKDPSLTDEEWEKKLTDGEPRGEFSSLSELEMSGMLVQHREDVNRGGYDKTKFEITFTDGNTYTGRYDIYSDGFGDNGRIVDQMIPFIRENSEEAELYLNKYQFIKEEQKVTDAPEGKRAFSVGKNGDGDTIYEVIENGNIYRTLDYKNEDAYALLIGTTDVSTKEARRANRELVFKAVEDYDTERRGTLFTPTELYCYDQVRCFDREEFIKELSKQDYEYFKGSVVRFKSEDGKLLEGSVVDFGLTQEGKLTVREVSQIPFDLKQYDLNQIEGVYTVISEDGRFGGRYKVNLAQEIEADYMKGALNRAFEGGIPYAPYRELKGYEAEIDGVKYSPNPVDKIRIILSYYTQLKADNKLDEEFNAEDFIAHVDSYYGIAKEKDELTELIEDENIKLDGVEETTFEMPVLNDVLMPEEFKAENGVKPLNQEKSKADIIRESYMKIAVEGERGTPQTEYYHKFDSMDQPVLELKGDQVKEKGSLSEWAFHKTVDAGFGLVSDFRAYDWTIYDLKKSEKSDARTTLYLPNVWTDDEHKEYDENGTLPENAWERPSQMPIEEVVQRYTKELGSVGETSTDISMHKGEKLLLSVIVQSGVDIAYTENFELDAEQMIEDFIATMPIMEGAFANREEELAGILKSQYEMLSNHYTKFVDEGLISAERSREVLESYLSVDREGKQSRRSFRAFYNEILQKETFFREDLEQLWSDNKIAEEKGSLTDEYGAEVVEKLYKGIEKLYVPYITRNEDGLLRYAIPSTTVKDTVKSEKSDIDPQYFLYYQDALAKRAEFIAQDIAEIKTELAVMSQPTETVDVNLDTDFVDVEEIDMNDIVRDEVAEEAEIAEFNKEQEAKAKEQAEKDLIASYDGFLSDRPMTASRERRALELEVDFSKVDPELLEQAEVPKNTTRKELIEIMIDRGWKIGLRGSEKGGNNTVLEAPNLPITIGQDTLTKTGMRYAEFLYGKKQNQEYNNAVNTDKESEEVQESQPQEPLIFRVDKNVRDGAGNILSSNARFYRTNSREELDEYIFQTMEAGEEVDEVIAVADTPAIYRDLTLKNKTVEEIQFARKNQEGIIGYNRDNQAIKVDHNDVRSYFEKGIMITQTVSLEPRWDGGQAIFADGVRGLYKDGNTRFVTVEEMDAFEREKNESATNEKEVVSNIWYFNGNPIELNPVYASDEIENTHIKVATTSIQGNEEIWKKCQADFWEEGDEIRDQIKAVRGDVNRGVGHSSMSVGDVIETDGKFYMCDHVGFTELKTRKELQELESENTEKSVQLDEDRVETLLDKFTKDLNKRGLPSNISPKIAQKLIEAMESAESAKESLYPDNKNMREIWSRETGVELPRTVKGTRQAIDEYFDKIKTKSNPEEDRIFDKLISEGKPQAKAVKVAKEVASALGDPTLAWDIVKGNDQDLTNELFAQIGKEPKSDDLNDKTEVIDQYFTERSIMIATVNALKALGNSNNLDYDMIDAVAESMVMAIDNRANAITLLTDNPDIYVEGVSNDNNDVSNALIDVWENITGHTISKEAREHESRVSAIGYEIDAYFNRKEGKSAEEIIEDIKPLFGIIGKNNNDQDVRVGEDGIREYLESTGVWHNQPVLMSEMSRPDKGIKSAETLFEEGMFDFLTTDEVAKFSGATVEEKKVHEPVKVTETLLDGEEQEMFHVNNDFIPNIRGSFKTEEEAQNYYDAIKHVKSAEEYNKVASELQEARFEELKEKQKQVKANNNNFHYENIDWQAMTEGQRLTKIREACETLVELEESGRTPTREDQEKLLGFQGVGAVKQVVNPDYFRKKILYLEGKEDEIRWGYSWETEKIKEEKDRYQNWDKKFGKTFEAIRSVVKSEDELRELYQSAGNAFYTSDTVSKAIWKIVDRLGFQGGEILEPSMGTGNIFSAMPEKFRGNKLTGVEKDSLTARIATQLFPDADVQNEAFQRTELRNNRFDLVVGNVPFSQNKVEITSGEKLNLHNAVIAESMNKLQEGGIAVLISSSSTMDNNIGERKTLSEKAQLLGAIRLPNNAFKNANTEVVTDILILRKNDGKLIQDEAWLTKQAITLKNAEGEEKEVGINEYFVRNPEMILGENSLTGSMYQGDAYSVSPKNGVELEQLLEEAIGRLPKNVPNSSQEEKEVVDIQTRIASMDEEQYDNWATREIDGETQYFRVGNDGLNPVDWDNPIDEYKIWTEKVGEGEEAEEIIHEEPVAFKWTNRFSIEDGKSFLNDYIELRQATKEMLKTDLSTDDALASKEAREKLNEVYDAYVEKHGNIHKHNSALKNRLAKADSDYYMLKALEKEVATLKGIEYKKEAIFSERTIEAVRTKDVTASNIVDASFISFNRYGKINTEYMGKLLSKSKEQVEDELNQSSEYFNDPQSGKYEFASDYLSGNIKEKIKAVEAEIINEPLLQKNLDALKEVIPPRLTIESGDIELQMGMDWIPEYYYIQFIHNEIGLADFDLEYVPHPLNEWKVDWKWTGGNGYSRNKIENNWAVIDEEGNIRCHVKRIINCALNNTKVSVNIPNGKEQDEEATKQAQALLESMRKRFVDYLTESESRREELNDLWNEKTNVYVPTKHDGSSLEFDGLCSFSPRSHQANAIMRNIKEREGLVAHGVGFGKTLTQIVSAYEMKRMGIADKPLIVAYNATYEQFCASARTMYPHANIMVMNQGCGVAGREEFLRRCQMTDPDMIIVPASQFKLFNLKKETQVRYLNNRLADMMSLFDTLDEDQKRGMAGNMIRRQVDKLEENIAKRLAKFNKVNYRKNQVFYEDVGFDFIQYDECHQLKNGTVSAKYNVSGVTNTISDRSLDAMMKFRHIQDKMNGKGVVGLSGTPVSNNITELYTMMDTFCPNKFRDVGIYNVDQFIERYAKIKVKQEFHEIKGSFYSKEVMAEFQNLRNLHTLVRASMDIQMDSDKVALNVPEIENKHEMTTALPMCKETLLVLLELNRVLSEYEEYKADLDRSIGEKDDFLGMHLVLLNVAVNASIDPRLVYPKFPDSPEYPINKAVAKIVEEYKNGEEEKLTQVLFLDRGKNMESELLSRFGLQFGWAFDQSSDENPKTFNLRDELKSKLVSNGIDPKEIAIIDGSTSQKKRMEICEKMNSGEIRLVIGSTDAMGVGLNMQDRVSAGHHIDPPRAMRPADMEQRNGRFLRDGNMNETVRCWCYGMENTAIASIYSKMQTKNEMIQQFLMAENFEGMDHTKDAFEELKFEEIASQMVGDPRPKILAEKKQELSLERAKVESHRNRIRNTQDAIHALKQRIKFIEEVGLPNAKEWHEKVSAEYNPVKDGEVVTIPMKDKDGKEFEVEEDVVIKIQRENQPEEKWTRKQLRDYIHGIREGMMGSGKVIETMKINGILTEVKSLEAYGGNQINLIAKTEKGEAFLTKSASTDATFADFPRKVVELTQTTVNSQIASKSTNKKDLVDEESKFQSLMSEKVDESEIERLSQEVESLSKEMQKDMTNPMVKIAEEMGITIEDKNVGATYSEITRELLNIGINSPIINNMKRAEPVLEEGEEQVNTEAIDKIIGNAEQKNDNSGGRT